MNKISKKDILYLTLSAILVLIDQIIKINIQKNLQQGESIDIIKNFFKLTYVKNTGAAFGILQNQKYVFLIIGSFTLIGLIYFFINTDKKLIKFCISLIIAGAIGNMIDRIKYGYVVDMFDFHSIWSYVFNFADICVVIGIILLSIIIFREK